MRGKSERQWAVEAGVAFGNLKRFWSETAHQPLIFDLACRLILVSSFTSPAFSDLGTVCKFCATSCRIQPKLQLMEGAWHKKRKNVWF